MNEILSTVEKEGGKFILDGRTFKAPHNMENGNWSAPSIVEVNDSMTAYKEEIFGPVLNVVYAQTFEEARDFINRNEWGNGTAIFTKSGSLARKFMAEIECG